MEQKQDIKDIERTLRNYTRRLLKYRSLTIFVEVCLKFFGLGKTIKILRAFLRERVGHTTLDMAHLDSSITIFNQIKESQLLKGKCLSQSLALQFILRRKSINSELMIGTYLRDGVLFAHAWLESEGEVLNDHPFIISQYKVITTGIRF